MTKKTENVDGKLQEEAVKKTVRKTRQPRKKTENTVKEEPKAEEQNKEKAAPVKANTRSRRTPGKKTEAAEQVIAQQNTPEQQEKPEQKVNNAAPKARKTTPRKAQKTEQKPENKPIEAPKEEPKNEVKVEVKPVVEAPVAPVQEPKPAPKQEQKIKPIPPLPNIIINDVIELANAPKAQICLSDQQIQLLTLEEAHKRFQYLEYTLANILDYDIVISDTNIWLELLVGHTSSHSDPRVNARLQFERQLEFISKLTKHRGGRFMIMAETYEEIDRFATSQEPTNYSEADWTDEALCRNVAARLAKRLILSQQRENRLRIEGIGAESHHGAFADPAIIRRTVELFAEGKKVLLLTNDASVAIRSMGMCDDLQRWNKISDSTWDKVYAPIRPMILTMDDLKTLDNYTRQYHFLQMAAGTQWMEDIPMIPAARCDENEWKRLVLWEEGFRPGDRHERHSDIQARQKEQQKKLEAQQKQQEEQRLKAEEQRRQKEEQRRLQSERDKARQAEINRQKAEAEAKQREEAEARQKAEAEKAAEEAAKQHNSEIIVVEEPANEAPAEQQEAIKEESNKKKSPRRGRPARSRKATQQKEKNNQQ